MLYSSLFRGYVLYPVLVAPDCRASPPTTPNKNYQRERASLPGVHHTGSRHKTQQPASRPCVLGIREASSISRGARLLRCLTWGNFQTEFQPCERVTLQRRIKPKFQGRAVNIGVFLRPSLVHGFGAMVNLQEKVTGMVLGARDISFCILRYHKSPEEEPGAHWEETYAFFCFLLWPGLQGRCLAKSPSSRLSPSDALSMGRFEQLEAVLASPSGTGRSFPAGRQEGVKTLWTPSDILARSCGFQ